MVYSYSRDTGFVVAIFGVQVSHLSGDYSGKLKLTISQGHNISKRMRVQ